MTTQKRHANGELLFGGDWACTTGDLEALAHVARCLAASASQPLRRRLLILAVMCSFKPDAAVAEWVRLKQDLLRQDGHDAAHT